MDAGTGLEVGIQPDGLDGLLRERTLTSLEDAYEKLQQRRQPSGPQEVYRQQCDRLRVHLARVCLAQLCDRRVRFCFYYPQDRQAVAFLKAVQLNPNLQELNVKDNGFESKAKLARLGRLLEEHGSIARVNLSQNRLAPGAFVALHSHLTQGTSLVCLKLSRCNLADCDGALLGEWLQRDKQLEQLDLSGNSLGERTAAALGAALRLNGYLIDLDLSWNTFNCGGFIAIAEGLAANRELRRLKCSFNGVEDKGLAPLLQAAALDTTRVRVLELDSCRITHLATDSLLQFLKRRSWIHALKLNGNLFRECDLLRLLEVVTAAGPELQLALLEMNNLPRSPAITAATPASLHVTLRTEKSVKVKLVNADSLGDL